jgi:predicted nucleotide-binding protein
MARPSGSLSTKPAQLATAQMHLGIKRLNKVIARIEQFEPSTVTDQFNTPELDGLKAAIDDALVQTFGADTLDYGRYKAAADFYCGPYNAAYATPAHEFQKSIGQSKYRSLALLREAVKALENRLTEVASTKAAVKKIDQEALGACSRKVFVVHGHDEGAREAVARFLERIEFQPIILPEQANKGLTIIEKVEEHADVGFAVVLLTPDDVGCEKGGTPAPRARQNVILELGYFIGRLGRDRVCALKRAADLEIPSDFGGVVYEKFDESGGWRQALGRELQEAGFDIDWNKVMR